MRTRKLILRMVLAVFGIGLLAFIGLNLAVFFVIPQESHNIREYSQLRTNWDQRLVGHFPAEVPDSASLKKFSHFPGFLQGGAHIQLRLRLPPQRIRLLYDQFESQRTKSFFGGDINVHINEKEGMPTTSFVTSDTNDHSFPQDYEVMIFDKIVPESERSQGFSWNHGTSHGVAISTNRSEIVYWAESW